MKIGIVCYPTVGGSGVIATEVARHAAANGHEVHLLSYDRPARLGDDLPEAGDWAPTTATAAIAHADAKHRLII